MVLSSSDKQKLIFKQLRDVRAKNKRIYARLEKLVGKPPATTDDHTMDLIEHAYNISPDVTRLMHRDILENDEINTKLTELLCG